MASCIANSLYILMGKSMGINELLLLSVFMYTSDSWIVRDGEGEGRYDGSEAGSSLERLWEFAENEELISSAAPEE